MPKAGSGLAHLRSALHCRHQPLGFVLELLGSFRAFPESLYSWCLFGACASVGSAL